MKKNKINNKGITLITLVVAVSVLLIISSILVYNAKNGIKLRALKQMQNDIELLSDKIDAYYVKYGALPCEIIYPNSNIYFEKGPNDNNVYYIIDLKAFDGIKLNYGDDYSKITNTMSQEEIKKYYDIYIINEQSHHIYYVKGIDVDGVMYYTNDADDEISTKIIPKLSYVETSEKTVKLVLNVINGSNMSYTYKIFVNGEQIKTGTTSEKRIETDDYRTVFDVGIQRAYAQIEYDGNTVTTGDISKEDLKIADLNELKSFRDKVNGGKTYEGKTIKQVADIDLGGESNGSWKPIGTESTPFKGIYDTEDNTISNIYINTQESRQGLFGYITGTLKNIGLESGTINAGSEIGAIVAHSDGGTIEYCYNKANINGVGDCISGICGYANNSTIIRRCYNAGNVTGTANNKFQTSAGISVLVGKSIEECYNTGNITQISNYSNCRAVGISDKYATVGNGTHQINSCYNTGIIKITQTGANSSWEVASGIAGQAGGAGTSTEIINCYNIGMTIVSQEYTKDKTYIRGCSMSDNTTITNCYYLQGTAPYERGRNSPTMYPEYVGNVKSESEMKKLASTLGSAFKDDINNINNGYPILSWQE